MFRVHGSVPGAGFEFGVLWLRGTVGNGAALEFAT